MPDPGHNASPTETNRLPGREPSRTTRRTCTATGIAPKLLDYYRMFDMGQGVRTTPTKRWRTIAKCARDVVFAPKHLEALVIALQQALATSNREVLSELNRLSEAMLETDTHLDTRLNQCHNDLSALLAGLDKLMRQLHDDNWAAAQKRHETIYRTIQSQHHDIWDSNHRMHDTLLRRLATIERAVRSNTQPSPEGHTTTSISIASEIRAFLGMPEVDPNAAIIRCGSEQMELPIWDKVVLPWLQQGRDWEPEVAEALASTARQNIVALDIGAHVGIFSLLLSRLVGPQGKVIAIEADPINAAYLRRNVLRATCNNVLVLEIAASDHSGTVPLSRSIEDNTGDTRSYDLPIAGDTLSVPAIALDAVVEGPVHLAKIDLQGMDHVALRGMSRILAEHRPTVIMEYWPDAIRDYGDDPLQVLSWIRDMQYRWSALEEPALTDQWLDQDFCRATESRTTGFVNLVLRPN